MMFELCFTRRQVSVLKDYSRLDIMLGFLMPELALLLRIVATQDYSHALKKNPSLPFQAQPCSRCVGVVIDRVKDSL